MSPNGPDTDTDAVRARPATPLPWEAEYDDCDCGPDDRSCGHKILMGIGPLNIEYGGDNPDADIEYALAAINERPALLAEIDRLRHLVDNRDRANALSAAGREAELEAEVQRLRTWATELAATAGVCPHCGDNGTDHTGCGRESDGRSAAGVQAAAFGCDRCQDTGSCTNCRGGSGDGASCWECDGSHVCPCSQAALRPLPATSVPAAATGEA